MRHVIWAKDDFFEIGGERIDMDPSVVVLPLMAPMSWMYRHDDPSGPYGQVEDIRFENGEITGELKVYDPSWNDDTLGDIGCRLGGWYTKVQKTEDGKVVTYCELSGVSVFPLLDSPGFNPAGAHPKVEA